MELSKIDVTPAKEKQFNRKGIFTAEDLLLFLPRKYNDFTTETHELAEGETACVVVTVNKVLNNRFSAVAVINAECTIDSTGEEILLTWFNQAYRFAEIKSCMGKKAFVAGKVTYNDYARKYAIASPDVFSANVSKGRGVYPVYSKIRGMSDEYLRDTIARAFRTVETTREVLPYPLVTDLGLLNMRDTLYRLHFPQTMKQVEEAQRRLLFNDLLYFALHNELNSRNCVIGSPFNIKTFGLINRIKESLPYRLTGDQENAVNSMIAHVKEGKRINALVQGDVGCGKTIIAFLMMAAFVDSGYQAVLMAPTQVLAKQHYEDLKTLVEPFGCSVEYLGSELKAAEAKTAKKRIENGEVQFIVGTHSVCNDVIYKNLAIAVTDEEHKFGMAQKAALVSKATVGVHCITMSATPIPRKLAEVIYGNTTQLYSIETKPEGRLPIITGIAKSREKIYRFVRSQVKKGHQVYVVCPMIDQNDETMQGVASVEEVSKEYLAALQPQGIRIATLSGRDKKDAIDKTITQFKKGEIDVLISTTVIEVGVNVPNATAIIISSAERFGLSSLHQLRGRVGRSNLQSYCVLESDVQTEKSRQRLDVMCQTNNGFEIAAADLEIRGPGDFLGTKQAGNDNKYMTLMLAYPEKYQKALEIAKHMLDNGTDCPLVDCVIKEREQM